jgi:hypothetical protein
MDGGTPLSDGGMPLSAGMPVQDFEQQQQLPLPQPQQPGGQSFFYPPLMALAMAAQQGLRCSKDTAKRIKRSKRSKATAKLQQS